MRCRNSLTRGVGLVMKIVMKRHVVMKILLSTATLLIVRSSVLFLNPSSPCVISSSSLCSSISRSSIGRWLPSMKSWYVMVGGVISDRELRPKQWGYALESNAQQWYLEQDIWTKLKLSSFGIRFLWNSKWPQQFIFPSVMTPHANLPPPSDDICKYKPGICPFISPLKPPQQCTNWSTVMPQEKKCPVANWIKYIYFRSNREWIDMKRKVMKKKMYGLDMVWIRCSNCSKTHVTRGVCLSIVIIAPTLRLSTDTISLQLLQQTSMLPPWEEEEEKEE